MSNQINITNISFVSTLNGEDVWGHGLPFASFETLVAKAKANASVTKLAVFPAHPSAAGNGRWVPETKSAIYRGQRSEKGNWYATVNTYNVGAAKKEVEVPQEVAKSEMDPMDFLTILGHFGSDAIARCHKSAKPFAWGKLYRHTFGTGWVEVPSKEMPSVMKAIVPLAAKPEAKTNDLAIQIAEDLVKEVAADRKIGMTYNGKAVWFSEANQNYFAKKRDGSRTIISAEELRAKGKISIGKK